MKSTQINLFRRTGFVCVVSACRNALLMSSSTCCCEHNGINGHCNNRSSQFWIYHSIRLLRSCHLYSYASNNLVYCEYISKPPIRWPWAKYLHVKTSTIRSLRCRLFGECREYATDVGALVYICQFSLARSHTPMPIIVFCPYCFHTKFECSAKINSNSYKIYFE